MNDLRRPDITRKTYLLCLCSFFILFSGLLLIGPRIPDDEQEDACVVNIDLPGIWGFSLNCDSPEFLRLAKDPRGLFEPRNERQARPGLIVAAHLVSLPLRPLNQMAQRLRPSAAREAPERIDQPLTDYFAVFVAYALLNAGLMLVTWLMLFSVWDTEKTGRVPLVVVPIAALTVSNPVFAQFYWSPHTQIFNILVPVCCVWAAARVACHELFERPQGLCLSLLIGLGVTAYATFVVYVPCLLIPAFLRRRSFSGYAAKAVAHLLLVGLPILAWIVIVRTRTGGFYNHEITAYGQFVWMFQQNFLQTVVRLGTNLGEIIAAFALNNSVVLVIAVFGLLLSHRTLSRRERLNVLIAALPVVLMAGFFSAVGFHPGRLIYTMVPPLYVILGTALGRISQERAGTPLVAVAAFLVLGWATYVNAIY